MSFPFEFAKRSGDYDFISPIVNFTGNACVVAVGGISLGVISNLALKALGFSEITSTVATAIPVTLGAVGIIGAVVGGCFFIAILAGITEALGRR
ncbi:MAG: hypothetical protein LW832_04220 [Parachlamydia sp.]|jgi:hypothetical protein|nr:hypothetical protein [Parachlamydia sp.]